MFRLNLKIAWRNVMKHRHYAIVNIIGLALGLAGFVFVVLFVNHEKSYDTWNPKLDQVYQMQEYSDYHSTDKKAHWRSDIDFRLSKIAAGMPQVLAVTKIDLDYRKKGITVSGKPSMLQSGIRRSDSLFFKVMPYEFKYGSATTAFLKPNSIVLKEALALKYFGSGNPLGKTMMIAGGNWKGSENAFTVTGVVKEPQTPSSVDFEAITFEGGDFFDTEATNGYPAEVYMLTSPFKDLQSLNRLLQKKYLPLKDSYLVKEKSSVAKAAAEGNAPQLRLAKLGDVHQFPLEQPSWRETLRPVILLSILLLLVSVINFVNLATAQATTRAKEIGVKKVIGAFRRTLVVQLLTETFIQCLMALFLALLTIELAMPSLNQAFNLQLSLFNGPFLLRLLGQLIGIVVIVGLLTGLYPALFMAAYRPREVLKGNFSTSKKGALVRKLLVMAQLVVSIGFIIGILVVNSQLEYLHKRDKGFTATGMLNVRSDMGGEKDKFFQRIKRIDGVKYVAFSSGIIGDNAASAQHFKYQQETRELYGLGVGIEGMQALDARLLAGRFFSGAVVQDTLNNAIINESAAKLFGSDMVGKTIFANDTVAVNIIGVIKDIQVEGLEVQVKPSIYVVETDKWKKGVGFTHKSTTLIRYDRAKARHVIKEVEKIYAEMNEFYPASYSFVEDDLSAVFVAHERFEKMVALFSSLSLVLSLFGLLALAAFITRQRTKEIAIRKVLGAAELQILLLLNKGYLWMIFWANVIAFPLAYIWAKKWLDGFAYRIVLTPLPFTCAFAASLVVTWLTVSLQARKATKANPVKALKYE